MFAIIRTRWETRPLSCRAKRRSSTSPGSLRKKYAAIVHLPQTWYACLITLPHLGIPGSRYYNNAWANHRLLAACARLTQADFEAPRTGFFPSIQATLNHILIIDRFYVDAFEGGALGPAAWADPIPFPAVADLRPA